jgi:hypothetical protein
VIHRGPSAQFVGLQTTSTRNGLGTVIRNRILTLDVDTLMGAGHRLPTDFADETFNSKGQIVMAKTTIGFGVGLILLGLGGIWS